MNVQNIDQMPNTIFFFYSKKLPFVNKIIFILYVRIEWCSKKNLRKLEYLQMYLILRYLYPILLNNSSIPLIIQDEVSLKSSSNLGYIISSICLWYLPFSNKSFLFSANPITKWRIIYYIIYIYLLMFFGV